MQRSPASGRATALQATGGTVFGSNLQTHAQPPQRRHLPSWSETQVPESFSSPASSY